MSHALRLSIAINLALALATGVLLWRDRSAARDTKPAPALPPAAEAAVPHRAADAGTESTSMASETAKTTPHAIAQLEQLGVPRDLIVNALLANFHRRWDRRFADLENRHAPARVPEREYIELARLREAEQVRELRAALGDDGYEAWDREQTLRVLNIGGVALTPDEAERAYRLQKEFDEEYSARQMAMEDGVADVADLGRLHAQAQERLDLELERLLGKARFDAMRGVADPIDTVYRTFGDIDPTPEQAQAALRAEEGFRAREAAMAARLREEPGDAASIAAELMAMSDAREDELRRIFGAEAYEKTLRENDSTYRQLTQFAQAWELQPGEIEPLYERLRAFHQQAERMRRAAAMTEASGHPVDWPSIEASIEAARQQTEAGLQSLIGGKRLWRLKQNGVLATR